MHKMPKFNATREDFDLIDKIADRAMKMDGSFRDRMTWHMDLLATHNSCPLDLQLLLDADNENFAHDVFGIRRHIDRETGDLTDCFVPRCARQQHQAA